jgi:hypothetical protein
MKDQLGQKVDAHTLEGVLGRRNDLLRQLDILDEKASSITTTLGEFTAKALARFQDIEADLDSRARAVEVKRLARQLERLRDRLEQMMEETGYGLVMDISKIPAHILESVYQSTLDDILRELRKKIGPHDTEVLIQEASEEVRMKTSGSELVHFDPPRLRVLGLASAVEKGLISAKQAHTTYLEFLRKLREPISDYKPVNFRAMLKLKSQEYAVDRSMSLADNMGDMEAVVREAVDASEAARAEMEELIAGVTAELASMREQLDALGSLAGRVAALEAQLESKAAGTPAEEAVADRVLGVLPEDGFTARRAFKELKGAVPEETVLETLEELVNDGRVERVARGRWTVYRPAVEIGEAREEAAPTRVSAEELEGDSRVVYAAVGGQGRTLNGLRTALKDSVKYTDLLRALRILIDGGLVTTTTRGRHTVYVKTSNKEVERSA